MKAFFYAAVILIVGYALTGFYLASTGKYDYPGKLLPQNGNVVEITLEADTRYWIESNGVKIAWAENVRPLWVEPFIRKSPRSKWKVEYPSSRTAP